MPNNPNDIDTFYEMWNSSRCKTAMLVISLLVFIGVVTTEVIGHTSDVLRLMGFGIIGYWTGRTSKANNPANPGS